VLLFYLYRVIILPLSCYYFTFIIKDIWSYKSPPSHPTDILTGSWRSMRSDTTRASSHSGSYLCPTWKWLLRGRRTLNWWRAQVSKMIIHTATRYCATWANTSFISDLMRSEMPMAFLLLWLSKVSRNCLWASFYHESVLRIETGSGWLFSIFVGIRWQWEFYECLAHKASGCHRGCTQDSTGAHHCNLRTFYMVLYTTSFYFLPNAVALLFSIVPATVGGARLRSEQGDHDAAKRTAYRMRTRYSHSYHFLIVQHVELEDLHMRASPVVFLTSNMFIILLT
jgi:hypothetical protein